MAEINYLNGYEIADKKARQDISGNTTAINEEISARRNAISQIQDEIESLDLGSPLVASSTSEMTETDHIYVNSTDGKWYYYDGDSWEIGGTYQAAEDSNTVNKISAMIDWDHDYNLYNPNDITEHAYIGSSTGNVNPVTNPDSGNYQLAVSNIIDVSDFDYIVFKNYKPGQLGLYREDDTFIETLGSSDLSIDTAISLTRTVGGVTSIAKHIRICYNYYRSAYPSALAYGTNDNTDLNRDYVPYNNTYVKKNHLYPFKFSDFENDLNLFYNEPNFSIAGIKQCAWRGTKYAIDPSTGYMTQYAPENSYPGFRKAGENKMDFLWLAGIRYTTDNEFYIMHDATTERTCTTNITVADSTSAQMDAVRLQQKGWITWSDDDLRVPKFEEVIKLAYRYNINLGIRLTALPNYTDTPERRAIWDKFIDICRRYHLNNAVYSGGIAQCNILKSYEPTWFVQITGSSNNTEQDNLDLLDDIIENNYLRKSVIFYKNNLTEDVMSYAHENGIFVFAVADEPIILPATLEQYKDLCVDAIITQAQINLTQ